MRDLFTEVGLIFKSTPSRRGRQSTVRAFTCSSDLNPLPHAEGDVYVRSPPDGMENLNPLPHAEGDFADSVVAANDKIFKSTPSRRGRRTAQIRRCRARLFKSTPSRRGRLLSFLSTSTAVLFKSTPSRRGRPIYSNRHTIDTHLNPLPHAEGDLTFAR